MLLALSACRERSEIASSETAGEGARADSAWVTPKTVTDSTQPQGFPADTAIAPPAAPPPVATPSTDPRITRPPAATPAPGRRTPRTTATPQRATGPASPADSVQRPDTSARSPAASPTQPAQPAVPAPLPPRPFTVGERLTYDVRFGPIRVGQASMEVVGIEPMRGRDAYHTRFIVRGGTAFFRVNDRYESWFDARTMESLRYAQQIDQGSYERERLFEMFPERRTFTEGGGPQEQPSVADPLDDGSFLYFLRTIPLEVGRTYEFNRYFRPDRNPVRVTVLRRESVRVPAGTFNAIVVRPTIKTTGIFSEGGRAEVWFADDSTRRMLQMKSRLSFGTLNLYLRSVQP
jgi:hypothetical protein